MRWGSARLAMAVLAVATIAIYFSPLAPSGHSFEASSRVIDAKLRVNGYVVAHRVVVRDTAPLTLQSIDSSGKILALTPSIEQSEAGRDAIEWLALQLDEGSALRAYAESGNGVCCMVCGGWSICAAEVETACGRCAVVVHPDDLVAPPVSPPNDTCGGRDGRVC